MDSSGIGQFIPLILCNIRCMDYPLDKIEVNILQDGPEPLFTDTTECPAAWCSEMDYRKINTPELFEREELFHNLAYKQYSIKEFRDGTAYELINQYIYD